MVQKFTSTFLFLLLTSITSINSINSTNTTTNATNTTKKCSFNGDIGAINKIVLKSQLDLDDDDEGKYSKRRRSNVAVIINRKVCIGSFFFYCLILNHSFQTNPNRITNCFKLFFLFTTLQLQCSCVRLFLIFEQSPQ